MLILDHLNGFLGGVMIQPFVDVSYFLYINNRRVSPLEALEYFWTLARNRRAYTLEETRRIFEAALCYQSTPHLKILNDFGLDVLFLKKAVATPA